MRAVFSRAYSADIGDHVFPTRKFRMVAERVREEGLVGPGELVDPGMPERDDVLLAHTPEWTDKIFEGRATLEDELRMELRLSEPVAQAHLKTVAGTILTCRHALETGLGLHVGGGSHHAFAGHSEGFCVLNDLAAALIKMLGEGRVARGAVVDLDVHQGNGTASILAGRGDAFTFSMHQEDIYPFVEPESSSPGTVDIGLPAGTSDEKYLKLLKAGLEDFLDRNRPELILYQAGVDCWEGDALGGLKLSSEGLAARDRNVLEAAFGRGVPAAVTLGGGYAEKLEDTVSLHVETIRTALDCHRRIWRG